MAFIRSRCATSAARPPQLYWRCASAASKFVRRRTSKSDIRSSSSPIHAKERDKPKGREKIDWKLLTDLPVRSCLDAIEKLEWYAQRWKIETFHKILNSGCRAEEAKLRTAERLVNLVAILCILSWRIFGSPCSTHLAEHITRRSVHRTGSAPARRVAT